MADGQDRSKDAFAATVAADSVAATVRMPAGDAALDGTTLKVPTPDGSLDATTLPVVTIEQGASSLPTTSAARIGRYAVLRKLGEGGMGVVLVGYDESLDRKAAVKVLH